MKKIVLSLVSALLMIVSFSSFAKAEVNPLKEKDSKSVMIAYVETVVYGYDAYHKYLFADDFEYRNSVSNDKFSKKQYLKFLKATKGFKFDCESNYQIMDETGKSCIAKATLTFPTFTRVDYITLNKSDEGWKVSKVVSTYPQ